MLLGNFEFVPFVQGMFDDKEQGAVFVFKHVKTGNHYACRYWDARRFTGPECYPLSLENFLKRAPSEVEVFVLPMQSRTRKAGEQVMNKVVDYLTEHGLYRGTASRVRGGTNVLDIEKFVLALFTHKGTGAHYYAAIASGSHPEKHLTDRAIEFNGLALKTDQKQDVIHLFCSTHFPFQTDHWDAVIVDQEAAPQHRIAQRIEEVSITALRKGLCVLNRIRTHSPLWYFNNLYRGKNITVEQYVALGSVGNLALNRQLQNPEKV